MIFPHAPYTLTLFQDLTYSVGSADNLRTYHQVQVHDLSDPQIVSSRHGLTVWSHDKEISSAILLAGGGATGVHEHSLVAVGDRAYVCVGNAVVALSLPHLEKEWFVQADEFTAFQIFATPECLIVHGELSISRVSWEGSVVWQHYGSDIFVTPNGEQDFVIEGDTIHAQSWDGRKYRIQLDGAWSTDSQPVGRHQNGM